MVMMAVPQPDSDYLFNRSRHHLLAVHNVVLKLHRLVFLSFSAAAAELSDNLSDLAFTRPDSVASV